MITLCGFPLSNYFNKVKLVLLEKGVPFVEEHVSTKDPAILASSPLGKVPFIRTEHGSLCESEVIVEYIEALHPEPRLLPADLWGQAKVRELVTFVELHLEWVARDLYPQAFFGGTVSAANAERVRDKLAHNITAFQKLARFAPYLAGEQFTIADCAAYVSLPLVALATKAVHGSDALAAAGIDWKSYVKLIDQRASAQKVTADRKGQPSRS